MEQSRKRGQHDTLIHTHPSLHTGIFIALMLRFDIYRARKRKIRKNQPKPYFTFTYVSYILGMVTTIGVMHFFQAAQVPLASH